MTYNETMALLDTLNDKLREVQPPWYSWDFLPNDWGHVFQLARALDIEVPGGPVVTPALKDPRMIALMKQELEIALVGQTGATRAYNKGQRDALQWVLGNPQ